MAVFVIYIGIFLVSYLLGSIPWGVLISTKVYKIDLRKEGSGNIGSTNAMRILGVAGGLSCFALDVAKGLLAELFALALYQDLINDGIVCSFLGSAEAINPLLSAGIVTINMCTSVAFMGAVYGHIFNPWLHFKGGKGIATACGCLFVHIGIPFTIVLLIAFLIVAACTKYVSAGSLTAAGLCFAFSIYLFNGEPVAAVISCLVALTVIWAHRSNIKRLREGTESVFSVKKR